MPKVESPVIFWLKIITAMLADLIAPLPLLYYVWREQKRGKPIPWWLDTPDDCVSPRGLYEPTMKKLHDRFGPAVSDYWWLAFRNRTYGLSYRWKPDFFKGLSRYDDLPHSRVLEGRVRTTVVAGHTERIYKLGPFGLIVGYRVGPIYDSITREPGRQINHPNMDARQIVSIRRYRNAVG